MPISANSDTRATVPRINLAESPDFDVGALRVSPARCEVRMDGERRELQPKVAQVLVALASSRSEVVSRDRLIEQCWDGRIVSDDVLNRCIVALRHLAKEFSPEPFTIETIPRVGYSLVEQSVATAPNARRAMNAKWAWGGLVAAALAGGAIVGWERRHPAVPEPASIAVLAFRNLSPGEPYFAEGIGEEILSQLSREPQFRVAGGASSSAFGARPDIHEVAQRLDVDYVLEGSVRTQGERVRVNADLVRATDGTRLWSDIYDGELKDIFAIQQQIGGAIAGSLRRKLVRAPALTGPLVTNGETYNLYLTARGLLRTRNRQVGRTAAGLLRDAINSDPGYAPAWASLAEATELDGALAGNEGLIAAEPLARRYALHALELDPQLSAAHRQLGIVAPYGSLEAARHFRKAAQLEPTSAENMLWLGVVEGAAGNFAAERAAYRRASQIDPLWFRTTGRLAMATAEMGQRAEAEAIANRGLARDQNNRRILLGRLAVMFGDYSAAAENWSVVARSNSPRWSQTAQRSLDNIKFLLGLRATDGASAPRAPDMRRRGRVSMAAAPTTATWLERNRNTVAADIYRNENHVAAKLMLGAGRTNELIETYRGSVGLLSIHAGEQLRADQITEAAVVALALRQAGRGEEAGRLLRSASALISRISARGPVPFWFDADAAGIAAVQGRRADALAALERAIRRGWTHQESTDLRDIADEPAFASLRGDPKFETIRARLNALHVLEREQVRRLNLG